MDQSSYPLNWLLNCGDPSLRARTLTELLDLPLSHPDVLAARAEIPNSPAVKRLLEIMHPDGYWLQYNKRKGGWVGQGVEYDAFATTHYCLSYLAELGMDRSHPQVAFAAERYMSLQRENGDWWNHMSCLLGLNLITFTRLGYGDDPHILRSLDLLLNTTRPDGGYLCDMHEGKRKTRPTKSCVRGAANVLLALSLRPETWDHPRTIQLVDYFLRRGGVFRSQHPNLPVNADVERISFPITWRANLWEILYALSRMGYGQDERLKPAWALLDARMDDQGRYPLDWTPTQCPWKVGARGQANAWVTFYALAAHHWAKNQPARKLSPSLPAA